MRNAPSRRAVAPGCESYASATLRAIGNTIPPARAAVEGMSPASTNSVSVSAYPSPSDRRPIARIMTNAIRRPSPVLIIPRDMKNPASTTQPIGPPSPASALETGCTPSKAVALTPSKTIAPPGTGRSVSPRTVATKIANKFQAAAGMSGGWGISATRTPAPTTAPQRQSREEEEGEEEEGEGGGEEEDEEEGEKEEEEEKEEYEGEEGESAPGEVMSDQDRRPCRQVSTQQRPRAACRPPGGGKAAQSSRGRREG